MCDLEDVFLHRTVRMPPLDDVGVAPVAAYVAFCALARVIDAIEVGDWLLRHGHVGWDELRDFCVEQRWRDGALEALWVLGWLDGDSWSLRESEVRSLLVFAGLPAPESNVGAVAADDQTRIGDLVYRRWGVVVEYEGEHHQLDRAQYVKDIDRYASLRRDAVPYVQVTKEKLERPRQLVMEVHDALVARGYDGPRAGVRRAVAAAVRTPLRRGGGPAAVREGWFRTLKPTRHVTATRAKPTLTHRHPADPGPGAAPLAFPT